MAGYIPDLTHYIKTQRLEEARTALSSLTERPAQDRDKVVEILALAPDAAALDLTDFLMEAPDLDQAFKDRLYQLAIDRAHVNHAFTRILLTHGRPEQIVQVTPLLKHVLSKATKGELLNLILRTAGKLRLENLTDDVAEFIFYDDAELKKESVKALERMGNATALKHLEHIARTDKCDMDILDAIDMLKEKLETESPPVVPPPPEAQAIQTAPAAEAEPSPAASAEPAIAPPANEPDTAPAAAAAPGTESLSAQVTDLTSDDITRRFAAYQFFCDNPALVAEVLHQNRESQSHDLLVNLLRLTARTIPQDAVGDLLSLAGDKGLDKDVKFSLLNALAAYPELESAATVLDAATDPAMHIRIAAIHVLNRHCSDFIAAEIKARIESGTKAGEALGIGLLDARATKLINALMASDSFSYITSNYLERDASVQVLDAYISVLEERNRISTVKKYNRLRLKKSEEKRPFFVVIHPTQAYLDVYARLVNACGYDVRLFSAPQEAFESIVFEKPAAVVCDLFVRQLTVLDLAKEIRELYPPKAVPIMVSSLQKELDKTALKQLFTASGINGFYPFPAKASQIKSWGSGG